MKDKKIIDNRYTKIKTLGSGGEGVAYLVLEKDTDLKLVCKTIEKENNEEELDYSEDEEFENKLEEKKRMFNKISSIECPYIISCKREGKGKITKNDKELKIRQYFIYEYAPRGDLWKIIAVTRGFGERCSKLLFKKILLGVQALHKKGIFHLDLKVDNIVLDDNYNPKICDFGFATDKQGKLKDGCGTKSYKAPQKFLNKEYSGEKADIFSLGCILFLLVVGRDYFDEAKIEDKLYYYVIKKNREEYFDKLNIKCKNEIKSLSKEFKDLYYSMISYKEDDRPKNIEEILKDKWFDEIKNLNPQKSQEIEDEVKTKFAEKENIINDMLKENPHLFDKFGYATSSGTQHNKGGEFLKEKDYTYFKPNFILENKKIELNGEFYIKFLGKFDYCYFMNYFVKEIQKKYHELKEPCFIKKVKENYKCNIEFEKDEEEDDDNDKNEDSKKDLIIRLNLYRSGDEELTLRFLRKSGDLHEYNEKVLNIISIAKEIK